MDPEQEAAMVKTVGVTQALELRSLTRSLDAIRHGNLSRQNRHVRRHGLRHRWSFWLIHVKCIALRALALRNNLLTLSHR